MNNVKCSKDIHLTQHFSLAEMCKTSVKTAEGNIPNSKQIENLKRVCQLAISTKKTMMKSLSRRRVPTGYTSQSEKTGTGNAQT